MSRRERLLTGHGGGVITEACQVDTAGSNRDCRAVRVDGAWNRRAVRVTVSRITRCRRLQRAAYVIIAFIRMTELRDMGGVGSATEYTRRTRIAVVVAVGRITNKAGDNAR